MKQAKRKREALSSRGQSGKRRLPKKITQGRERKTKKARLKCRHCGKYFEDLGQINKHYSYAGHKKQKKPPKKLKLSKDYTAEEIQVIEVIFELLRNPQKMREHIRDAIDKAQYARRKRYDYLR